MTKFFQRGDDGYPVGSDAVLREACGPIPDVDIFQHHLGYGYQKPKQLFGWVWRPDFGRWGALVQFADGWKGVTSPAPWRKHHDDCPVCGERLSCHSPDGFDVIYECDGHHRHILKGITGEYITLRPSVPRPAVVRAS